MDFGFFGMKRRITPLAGFLKGSGCCGFLLLHAERCPTGGRHSCERSLRLNRLFGCFPHPLYGGGITLPVCGFSSDLDQNRAALWSKSELETPETPETLETPETPDVDVGIAFL